LFQYVQIKLLIYKCQTPELFSGETEELLELGAKLSETYGLTMQEDSKYARGIELIQRNRD
ncbi:MAG: hypothetical protein Q4C46_11080, partial [Bacillota bacterium]|nr:hypothetical protein [Bacillota bacterium]